ncbi:MAG: flagellar basal body-associated FliL family protein [Acidobacteria bacterium]|nr:flagellar basal body-associated FliL family protein [Acidobacteriota bacterium]MBI3426988.1 flagellar basal body-associated FliL family protein [Acidobacteriota bacterium]
MSDSVATEKAGAAPPKSNKMVIIIVIAVVVLAGAGGSAYYYLQHSKVEAKAAAEKGKKKPAKGDEEEPAADEEANADEAPGKKPKSAALTLPDDSAVKHVIELQPYIVNLADAGEARYLRLTVSLGVGGEEKAGAEKPDALFTTRIRNAMLAVLTTKSSAEVLTAEGKNKLRKELLRAARAASEEPKVEAIYITEFIVQL